MSKCDKSPAAMKDWPTVRAWRATTRKELLRKRLHISSQERRSAEQTVCNSILENFSTLSEESIGCYWPIKGEIDLRPLLQELLATGADVSLPVVIEKDKPLEFRAWHTNMKMSRGIWNIPIPSERKVAVPTLLLIPLLGFDITGHRLGNGGGYYDRTLAALRLKPTTIGVGFNLGRLATIHPQAHDYPLDAIVTEAECLQFESHQTSRSGASSPPCYLHEFDGDKNTGD